MRYKYGVVLYQPEKFGKDVNPNTAVVYYSNDMNGLSEAVTDYIKDFELREEDFKAGQVFDPADSSTFIGRITYNGKYEEAKAV